MFPRLETFIQITSIKIMNKNFSWFHLYLWMLINMQQTIIFSNINFYALYWMENSFHFTWKSFFTIFLSILNTDNLLLYLHYGYPALSITFIFYYNLLLLHLNISHVWWNYRYNMKCTRMFCVNWNTLKGRFKNECILVKMSIVNLHKMKLNKIIVIWKSSILTF